VRDVADSAGVFNRVLCWLKSIFRTENYDSCMAAAAS
jgi:hypothetical protein